MTRGIQSLPSYEEWLATEYRPIRGGAPEGDAPAGGAEDQGADGTDSGLYNLDSVDPDIRTHLEPHLKEIQGNVEKKFREAADYRKQWQPFEELGLQDVDPGSVKQLLDFAQLAKDPEQFAQWWKAAGEEAGLTDQFKAADDLDLEDVEDLSKEGIAQLISEKVAEGIDPIKQSLEAQAAEARESQASQEVNDAYEKLKGENEALFEGKSAEEQDKIKNAVAALAYPYSDDSSLSAEALWEKGFAEYTSLIGQGEKGLLADKAGQPAPPEGAGAPSTSDDPITSFNDPRLKARGMEKLKNVG